LRKPPAEPGPVHTEASCCAACGNATPAAAHRRFRQQVRKMSPSEPNQLRKSERRARRVRPRRQARTRVNWQLVRQTTAARVAETVAENDPRDDAGRLACTDPGSAPDSGNWFGNSVAHNASSELLGKRHRRGWQTAGVTGGLAVAPPAGVPIDTTPEAGERRHGHLRHGNSGLACSWRGRDPPAAGATPAPSRSRSTPAVSGRAPPAAHGSCGDVLQRRTCPSAPRPRPFLAHHDCEQPRPHAGIIVRGRSSRSHFARLGVRAFVRRAAAWRRPRTRRLIRRSIVAPDPACSSAIRPSAEQWLRRHAAKNTPPLSRRSIVAPDPACSSIRRSRRTVPRNRFERAQP
jgi:hypothetical protein